MTDDQDGIERAEAQAPLDQEQALADLDQSIADREQAVADLDRPRSTESRPTSTASVPQRSRRTSSTRWTVAREQAELDRRQARNDARQDQVDQAQTGGDQRQDPARRPAGGLRAAARRGAIDRAGDPERVADAHSRRRDYVLRTPAGELRRPCGAPTKRSGGRSALEDREDPRT